ncbi:glycerol kinase [Halorhodospira halochloris]|uniref:Glycerol kinase n=1 Tax=Halorhodospira halochloris TaxID=1052 RepID=A0A0X8X8H3_HALHR|nr:glycerol kinase GlpK [Halorhodospira halochloris]BAU57494.1 glycerol kinase [Halorhodospira halochloris]
MSRAQNYQPHPSESKVILALDQGTTSSRAMVFNASGEIVAVSQEEFTQLYPQPGWVEHDPEEIWATQNAVMGRALLRAGLDWSKVAAIGVTNQRETTVVWDRETGQPIYPAIVWQDRRTADICQRLQDEGLEELFRSRSGLLLDPYLSGTKIRWILDQVTGAQQRAEAGELAFGTIDSWLIWKLTAGRVHATDATNASRTLLFDIHKGDWDDELLGLLGIPRAVLPEVRDSSGFAAPISCPGIPSGAVIAGVAGDQQAALFGQICNRPGLAKATYGTGGFVLLNTGSTAVPSANGLLTTIAWRRDGKDQYALEGSVFIAGAVVQWLRDGLGIIRKSAEIEELASSVPDSGGVHLVPAFVGLGAPWWDAQARGIITGLTRGTSSAHIARAALEAIALQICDVAQAMEADAGMQLEELRVDGGAAANDLLLQTQADLLGVPVVRPQTYETTALGAAYLAGLAVGFWRDEEQIAAQWQMERRFDPAITRGQAQQRIDDWHRAVARARG